ncbi:hypothetical protein [Scytonema millei]|uniref:Uncharacterized protein n=1 Tax=Scytonema millei VB511283 TaxID=1245923 RepID=A0A9X5E6Q5_9CYAN|nr:hypothetical protein [Scytonema millei]NHC36232.1 hypothetical protein [Scytonema millei VB511283]
MFDTKLSAISCQLSVISYQQESGARSQELGEKNINTISFTHHAPRTTHHPTTNDQLNVKLLRH